MLILVSFKSTKTQQVGNNIKIIRNSSYIDLALSQASLFPCLEPLAHCTTHPGDNGNNAHTRVIEDASTDAMKIQKVVNQFDSIF